MMTIDKLEIIVDKMTERLRNLNFTFHDADIAREAEDAREEAVAGLENYLELAIQDWESRPDADERED